VIAVLVLLTLSRLALCLWLWDRVSAAHGLWPVLLGGWRIDACLLAMVAGLPALLSPWLGHRRLAVAATAWWYRIWWMLYVLLEVSTPQFIAEYDTRPNRLYFVYLTHPHEVGAMLWHGYKGVLLAVLAVMVLAGWGAARLFGTRLADSRMRLGWRPVATIVMLPLIVLVARGTLQHRPINPAMVAFTTDSLVNTLPLNSLYSVFDAAYRMRDERSSAALYGAMPEAEMQALVRQGAGISGPVLDPLSPTLHAQVATATPARPLNLVIILQESLGAQFVGNLGGRDLTPELDRLAQTGWSLDRAYATGTRSARGLEAVTAGFPPTAAEAVLTLPRAQTGFFTLAQALDQKGYRTRFIYGGEAHFDNMRSFFFGNGVKEIIDINAFDHPKFVGSWGASDEDMFNELDRRLAADGDAPSFTLAFSVSNHTPWEYPAGRIQPQGPPASVENTVRYADWAIGRFFEHARTQPYWQNTVFLVIADHDARVFGASQVPVTHFHIPALILGAGVPVRHDERIVSQIDMPPTLLSLIGVSTVHPMIGADLTRDGPNRALMQYGDNFAYLKGDQLVVLEPGKPALQYRYAPPAAKGDESYAPAALDAGLAREALAHAIWPSWAYLNERYRMPAASPP
jgi:phosphoglycerol transferase MdoB-like AlkP superfamily enzyme